MIRRAAPLLIPIAAMIVYLPAMRGQFLPDDDELLTHNPLVHAADGLSRTWLTTEAQDYWPISQTSLWIEWRLWGMNPLGYHVTNLLLHVAASMLLYVLLRQLAIPGALLAALLFALHPVNVEAVAWIAQRKTLLAMVFFLLSILCWLRSGGYDRWYVLSVIGFLLAMLSKGSAVTLPLILLLLAWWRNNLDRRALMRTTAFFGIALVLGLVNVWFQTHGKPIVIRDVSVIERLLGAAAVVWFYLSKALLPIDLIFIYPKWDIAAGQLQWWLPLIACVAVTALLWRYRKAWARPWLLAWGCFVLALVPVMGFADVGFMKYTLVADHYQYMAIVAPLTLLVAGWQRLHRQAATPALILALGVGALLGALTWAQCGIYRDEPTINRATLAKNPDCVFALNNRGVELMNEGRIIESIAHLEHALKLDPDSARIEKNLGLALLSAGRAQEALEHSSRSVQLDDSDAEAHSNLGAVLAALRRWPEAVEQYQRALQLNEKAAEAWANMAVAMAAQGKLAETLDCARRAIEVAEARNDPGMAQSVRDWLKTNATALNLPPDFEP
ncbi:MAG: tetratricopeptide repeat protein [Phycisphaeraceae bacterium]|nr:tetratricopeptide repeat protein [Phycisphaeraceae bacterium]